MRSPQARLWGWFLLYLAVMVALAAYRHRLWTYGADLGIFAQVVQSAFDGFRDGPERGTHFRFHWSPILAVLWPLVALTRSTLSLQIAQAILLGATVIPLRALASRYVGEEQATRYAALFLLYPPLLAIAFLEFHEVAFFPIVVVALVLAADRERWGWFAALAFISATIREDACITLAIAGFAFAAAGFVLRNRRGDGLFIGRPRSPRAFALAGFGLAIVNVAALAIYFGAVVPRAGAWQPSHFYAYPFAAGPIALVLALLAHPSYILGFLKFGRLTYALEAFGPLAFLPFFSRWTLLAIPSLVMLLLSNDSIAWRMGEHYAALWLPWLLLAALAALVRFERAGGPERTKRWTFAMAAICIIVLIGSNPMHPAHYLKPFVPHTDAAEAMTHVPANARIVTHDEWYGHLALERRNLGIFLCPEDEYAVYDDDFPSDTFIHGALTEVHDEMLRGTAKIVWQRGSTKVYRRVLGQRHWLADCR